MFDELFEKVPFTAFIIGYIVGLGLLFFMKKFWAGTAAGFSTVSLIIFAVALIPVTYLVLYIIASKDN